ncbi:MAG: restriction endonuclease subunit S [Acidimicrobiales bacterium]
MNEDLPRGWAQAVLGELVSTGGLFSDGDWVETKDQDPAGEVRLTQLADVGDGVWLDRSDRYLTETSAERLRCTFLEAGDVLVARMPHPLGRACLFPGSAQRCVTVVDVAIVRPGRDSVDPRWLMHTINSPAVRSEIERMQAGTTRKRISRKNLGTITLPVSPLAEQNRIVRELERRLSHVDAARSGLEIAEHRLTSVRASLREAVASGSLLGLDPASWTVTTTGEVAKVRGGIQKQPKRRPIKNTLPFLRVANVGRGELDLAEVHEIEVFEGECESYGLQAGDLLVVEGNGSIDQIGRAAMWDGSIDPCVHQNHLIRVRPSADLDPSFLALVWNAPSTIEQLKAVASSTSGLHTLSTAKVKSVNLTLPKVDDQRRLVAEAERRLSLIAAAEGAVEASGRKAVQLRRSLLAAAVDGRLVPQDPSDEPAEVLLDRIRSKRAAEAPARSRRPRTPRKTKEPAA